MRSEIPPGAKILEISPLANPCAPKGAGYRSYRVDRLGREELLKYYADHPLIAFDKIEEVDFVWKSGELIEHVPAEHHGAFDVVIASNQPATQCQHRRRNPAYFWIQRGDDLQNPHRLNNKAVASLEVGVIRR